MALQFEFIRGLMFVEMGIFVFLLLPLPTNWRKKLLVLVSKSRLPSKVKTSLQVVFMVVLVVFIDSVNRSIRATCYDKQLASRDQFIDAQFHAKMFYAQRNMYLTGFTLFLSLLLNSFVKSLVLIVTSEEQMEVLAKQAKKQNQEYLKTLSDLQHKDKEIKDLRQDLEQKDKQAMQLEAVVKQANATREEYYRLADQYNQLEKKLGMVPDENKKSR